MPRLELGQAEWDTLCETLGSALVGLEEQGQTPFETLTRLDRCYQQLRQQASARLGDSHDLRREQDSWSEQQWQAWEATRHMTAPQMEAMLRAAGQQPLAPRTLVSYRTQLARCAG